MFLYTASVVKPVLPLLVDVLAHTFQELEHTSTVHAHNGEQHVHLEMQSLVAEQHDDAPAPTIEFSVTPHLVSTIEIAFLTPGRARAAWGRMIPILPVTHLRMPFPPPRG
ncbi:MAG TPA: hypothetical protein VGB56_07170 [Flavisolibacter sp.]